MENFHICLRDHLQYGVKRAMKNRRIGEISSTKMADILEFKNENPFKISAYRKASRIIGDLTQDIEEIAESGEAERRSRDRRRDGPED